MTESMQRTIDETSRRREKQIKFNEAHSITPKTILKSRQDVFASTSVLDIKGFNEKNPYAISGDYDPVDIAAEEEAEYKTIPQMEKAISKIKKEMEKAARDLDFMEAARLRDSMFTLQKKLTELKN
jgi:excinuclease ABC subunit B